MKESNRLKSASPRSEESFRVLFDAIEDSVIMFEILPDDSRGPIEDINRATCDHLGYSREELLGMTVMDISAEESIACRISPRQLYADGKAIFEAYLRASSGQSIPVEVNARKFEYDGREMILAICRDISARKNMQMIQEENLCRLESEVEMHTSHINRINSTLLKQTEETRVAEAKVLQAEKDIRGIIDASHQSIFMISPDGTVLYVNRTVAGNFDCTPEEMVGKIIYDYIPTELAQKRKARIDWAVKTRQTVNFRDSRNGNPIFHVVHPIVENDEVSRVAIYSEDLSEIFSKERELEQSRHIRSVLYDIISHSQLSESLEELLESIHKTMLKELRAENLYVALINDKNEELRFEYCIDNKGSSCPTIYNINDPSNKMLSLLPARKNMIIHLSKSEIEAMVKDNLVEVSGTIPEVWLGVPMRIKGKPAGVLVIQDYDNPERHSDEDIRLFAACSDQLAIAIERNKYDTAIRESAEQFKTLFEDNHSAMLIIDPSTGMILGSNKAAEKLYGISKEEMPGKHIYDFNTLTPDEINAAMLRAEARNQKSFIFRHRTAGGKELDVEVFSGPFLFRGRTRLISIIHDITDRIRNEQELSKAKEEAITANKAKDEFLANISHEIRTPLNGVMGMLQLLQHSEMNHNQKSNVDIALQSSRNLLRVLDDILDLSKIEMKTLTLIEEPFVLEELVEECLRLFTLQAEEKGLELGCSISPEIKGIYIGDEGRIRQIIFNLIGNAIKFTDSGSVRISITMQSEHPDHKKILLFMVSDTGVGIPEDKIDIIFNSFTQVDGSLSRRYMGAGLGLAIVKRLLKLMGGTIRVESRLGHGTDIIFTLPLYNSPETAVSGLPRAIPAEIVPMRILLVEDERVNRMMARMILEKMGHHIISAENGQECLQKLEMETVDVILMDIQMPVLDGLETTKIIRTSAEYSNYKDIPIIALSAHANDRNKATAEKAGMDDYISKPFEWTMLERTLGRISVR